MNPIQQNNGYFLLGTDVVANRAKAAGAFILGYFFHPIWNHHTRIPTRTACFGPAIGIDVIAIALASIIAVRLDRSLQQSIPKQVAQALQDEANHESLSRLYRAIASPVVPNMDSVISLPTTLDQLEGKLLPIYRQITNQYQDLAWPQSIQHVVVLTKVVGGKGDIVAGAKAIALMQTLCSTLTFDWVVLDTTPDEVDSFLLCSDPSKVSIRSWRSQPQNGTPNGDLLVVGPTHLGYSRDQIESSINRKICGPMVHFLENAELFLPASYALQLIAKESETQLYSSLFPNQSNFPFGCIPMGLQIGTGVFLDSSRVDAFLSDGYCDYSYVFKIQNLELRQDILNAMEVTESSMLNYGRYSLNAGYAHRPESWGNFIDCVAIHEKNKHVVIVLNQRGELGSFSLDQFKNTIFSQDRLSFLRSEGYGQIQIKDGTSFSWTTIRDGPRFVSARRLTIILRPSFQPQDMKFIQLASERLLATGDNSAVEALCARCKLYLYEDVRNGGCKWRFLQQQVDVAARISPELGRLLALFGRDRRLCQSEKVYDRARMKELLECPGLSDATLQFCDTVVSKYSFAPFLEGMLKRAMWNHLIPELIKVETSMFDERFFSGMEDYLRDPAGNQITLRAPNIPNLHQEVHRCVEQFNETQPRL